MTAVPDIPQHQPLTVVALNAFVSSTLKEGKGVRRLRVEPLLFLEVRPRTGVKPPTGSASWVLRYTFAGIKTSQGLGSFVMPEKQGKPEKEGIASQPKAKGSKSTGVSLASARDMAHTARSLLVGGVNPVQHKREGLQAAKNNHERTVQFAVEQWLAADTKKLTSPKYAAQKQRRLLEVLNYSDSKAKVRRLGGMPVALTTTENVTDSLGVLVSRGTHETARRVLSDLECRRRLNIDPPCRSNIDPGRVAGF